MIKKTSSVLPNFHYFVKGENPKLLIHSGTHGDEFEVIDVVKKCIEKYEDKLPDFVFVPCVSPSAVSSKTRVNNNGSDLNRIFFSDSKDIEVQENIRILNNYNFNLMVTFHEDPEFNDYYIYDESQNREISEKILKHNQKIKKFGVPLLTGVDDQTDPFLGHNFIDGYAKFELPEVKPADGSVTIWLYSVKKTKGIVVPEIPGRADFKTKELIVDTFFSDILLLL